MTYQHTTVATCIYLKM